MNQEAQPEALRLADKLETQWAGIVNTASLAATELRRLYAESEQLKVADKQALELVRNLTELLDDGESHTPQCCSNFWAKPCDCTKQTTLNNANAWLADKL
jgi:hypothetical protein